MWPQRPTLADRVSLSRRRAFVGRDAEQALFRHAVEGEEPPFAVLHVHGPGGIGKSALLRVFGELARDAGAAVIRIDGRDVECDLGAVQTRVAPARRSRRRTVLLIDTYEMMTGLDSWLREELMPELRGDTIVVLAGRRPPMGGWLDDPGWRALCEVMPLGPLSARDAIAYLADTPMPAAQRKDVLGLAAGYPLVLTLAKDLAHRGTGSVPGRLSAPGAVGGLVAGLVDTVPDVLHRRALQVCAWARTTTETLLREVLGLPDAAELFEWLRAQPYVETGAVGLHPHDAVREVLVADLRWRDPAGADELNEAVRRCAVTRARNTNREESDHGLQDLLFIWRHNPATRRFYDWDLFGSVLGESVRPADRDAVCDIVAHHSGGPNADLVGYWFDRRPESFLVYRRDGVVQGLLCKLILHEVDESELGADPLSAAAWRWARGRGVQRGQPMLLTRCMLDRDAGERASPAVDLASQVGAREVMTRADLTVDFVLCVDPDFWAPFYAGIGYVLASDLTATVGEQQFAMFVRDWRSPEVPHAWRDVRVARPTTATAPDTAFADAVRHALRNLHRPECLAASILLDTAVAGSGPELHDILTATVESLHHHPRDV